MNIVQAFGILPFKYMERVSLTIDYSSIIERRSSFDIDITDIDILFNGSKTFPIHYKKYFIFGHII